MEQALTPAAVRSRALAARVRMSEVLKRAQMHRSVFSRWERGADAQPLTVARLGDALAAIEAERQNGLEARP